MAALCARDLSVTIMLAVETLARALASHQCFFSLLLVSSAAAAASVCFCARHAKVMTAREESCTQAKLGGDAYLSQPATIYFQAAQSGQHTAHSQPANWLLASAACALFAAIVSQTT